MAWWLGATIGGLIPTFLISRLLLWLTRTWDGGIGRLATVHALSLLLASLIGGMGMADAGAFAPIEAAVVFAVPQLIWLGVDLARRKPNAQPPPPPYTTPGHDSKPPKDTASPLQFVGWSPPSQAPLVFTQSELDAVAAENAQHLEAVEVWFHEANWMSESATFYEDFARRYPTSRHAEQARTKIAQLGGTSPPDPPELSPEQQSRRRLVEMELKRRETIASRANDDERTPLVGDALARTLYYRLLDQMTSGALHFVAHRRDTLTEDDREFLRARRNIYDQALRSARESSDEAAFRVLGPRPLELTSDDEFVDQAANICSLVRSSIEYGLASGEPEPRKRLNFWEHDRLPLRTIRSGTAPRINKEEITAAVGDYIGLPYRSALMDRVLLEILVSRELYAFGDETLDNKWRDQLDWSDWLDPHNINRIHPLIVMSGMLGFGALITSVMNRLAARLDPYGDGPPWVGQVTWGLYFAASAIVIVVMLGAWRWHVRTTKKVKSLLDQMIKVQMHFGAAGPISVAHLRDLMRIATQAGVVWPAALPRLLDDIQRRTDVVGQ